jgi:hypothetical protein
MKKLLWASVISILAVAPAAADPVATKGAMLHSADGVRLGEVDRLGSDGSVQLIFDGRVVTVPGSTLTLQDGELITSLKKTQIMNLKA